MHAAPQALASAWLRPRPVLGLAGLLGMLLAGSIAAESALFSSVFYVVAFLGAGLSLLVCAPVERAAWACTPNRRSLLVAASTALLFLGLAAASLPLSLGRGTTLDPIPHLASLAHLAALALLVQRASTSGLVRCLVLLLVAWVLPALVPMVRPLLDPRTTFDAALFAPLGGGWSPILTLTVIALALPSPAVLVGHASS